jgi:hypothetical protein
MENKHDKLKAKYTKKGTPESIATKLLKVDLL